jgi:hypothetical protein
VVLQVVGKARGELADGERGVRAEVADGSLDTGPRPVPHLALGVARPHEESHAVVGVPRREDEHRLGLVESGQVIEVGILPVLVLDVVVPDGDRGRGEHHHAPFELGHQSLAAIGVDAHAVRA